MSSTAVSHEERLTFAYSSPGNDPLAYFLCKLGLLGRSGFRSWVWPLIFSFFYVIINDVLLPVFLGRFSSSGHYIGPLNPLLLPYRLADIFLAPVLIYCYGQIALVGSTRYPSNSSTIFQQFVDHGFFGPQDDKNVQSCVLHERMLFARWLGTIWIAPVALGLALALTDISSLLYTTPSSPRLFINSDAIILFLNTAMWLLLAYMIMISAIRLLLLDGWLVALARRYQQRRIAWRTGAFNTDDRQRFSPIGNLAILAALFYLTLLLLLSLIFLGRHNLGIVAPALPNWAGYLSVLLLLIVTMLAFLYVRRLFLPGKQDKVVPAIAAAREEQREEQRGHVPRAIQVREPIYQFCAQTKYSWAFAIVATWILGSLMWQVMYFAEKMAPGYLVPQTPGPNDFLSAVAGDFFALPAINGLIVLFYHHVTRLEISDAGAKPQRPLIIGGALQTSVALLIAVVMSGATFTYWAIYPFVTWTLPRVGEQNVAGLYHEVFITVQVYFLVNFLLSAARVLWRVARFINDESIDAELLAKRVRATFPLVRIFGGIGLAGDFFVLVLCIDVLHHLISVPSYIGTAAFAIVTIAALLALCLGVYRKFLSLFLADLWAPILPLIALGVAIVLLVPVL